MDGEGEEEIKEEGRSLGILGLYRSA